MTDLANEPGEPISGATCHVIGQRPQECHDHPDDDINRVVNNAIPFLGHALDGLRTGEMQRVMFLAKGSLFLGRMTQMADGLSFILTRNMQR